MNCPKCGCPNCKMEVNKSVSGRDFKIGRGLVGALIFGPIGGGIGWSNSRKEDVMVKWQCLNCRYEFFR